MAFQIQCFTYPCDVPAPTLPSTSYPVSDLFTMPPTIGAPTGRPPIDLPMNGNGAPTFGTSTDELDRYRALFLVLGILIGAFLIAK